MNPKHEAPSPVNDRFILVDAAAQKLYCYQQDVLIDTYVVSTGKNGLGERLGSGCTPRGWHAIHAVLGLDAPIHSVFVSRQRTGEIYSAAFAHANPGKDWILTRILQLDGLEPGRNQDNPTSNATTQQLSVEVELPQRSIDSLRRYIYIHGTPDSTTLGIPGSRGCIRMRNSDIIELAENIEINTRVFIE